MQRAAISRYGSSNQSSSIRCAISLVLLSVMYTKHVTRLSCKLDARVFSATEPPDDLDCHERIFGQKSSRIKLTPSMTSIKNKTVVARHILLYTQAFYGNSSNTVRLPNRTNRTGHPVVRRTLSAN